MIKFIEYEGIEGYIELMKNDVKELDNPGIKNIELCYSGKDIKAVLDYITTLQEDLRDACEVIEKLKKDKRKAINILKYSASNKGMCTQPSTDSIQSALLVLQGDDNNEN